MLRNNTTLQEKNRSHAGRACFWILGNRRRWMPTSSLPGWCA